MIALDQTNGDVHHHVEEDCGELGHLISRSKGNGDLSRMSTVNLLGSSKISGTKANLLSFQLGITIGGMSF